MLDDSALDDSAFPISPENSVLGTLGSFHRTSPSPTPSKLVFTWSSGDIPVILYDNAYIDERVSGLFISGNNKRESVVTLGSDASPHFSQRFSTGSRASLIERNRESVIISGSASSDTIRSARMRKQPASSTTATRHSSSSHRSSKAFGEQPSPSLESTLYDDCETEETLLDGSCFPRDTILKCVSGHLDSGTCRSSHIGDECSIERAGTPLSEGRYAVPLSSSTRSSILLGHDADDPGDIKRSDSVQTWFSLGEWDYKDPRRAPRGVSIARQQSDLEMMSPLPSRIPDHQEALSPFERPSDSTLHGIDTFLKATTVQFLIDQEGFRDAEATFQFSGISRVRSSIEHRVPDGFMAQFRPVSRQQFHFHHAPLETPPVLRRITVNNDDTSDYVSRQAHLTLKSNGVYVIHGHEVLAAEHGSEQTKLYWQFEYLVDDRRVQSSGSSRHLEGEKTFTPLTFSCSPRLLLPSQAKRINIMHVFKKTLAPKLVAQKLQVRLGTLRSASNPSPEQSLSPKVPPHYRNSRSHDLHSRRATDDVPGKRAVSDPVLRGSHSEWSETACGTDDGHQTRSFALESLSRFSLPPLPVAKGDDQSDASPPILRGSHAIDRHIVPPARLSELLIQDSSSKDGRAPRSSSGRSSLADILVRDHDSNEFVALSPRPKRPTSMKVR